MEVHYGDLAKVEVVEKCHRDVTRADNHILFLIPIPITIITRPINENYGSFSWNHSQRRSRYIFTLSLFLVKELISDKGIK